MRCTVTLADNSFMPIRDPGIEIEAFIPAPTSKSIELLSNTGLGTGSYGAILTLMRATDVYDVIIHTISTLYAPLTLQNLSGTGSPQLDLILDSISSVTTTGSTVGASPASAAAVAGFILQQLWPDEGKRGILSCINTLSYVRRVGLPRFGLVQRQLESLLDSLRINPRFVT